MLRKKEKRTIAVDETGEQADLFWIAC